MTAINKQGLPWKAMLRGELEGRTVGSFGMGFKPLPEEVRKQYTTTLDTTGFTPPVAYDARDRYAADPGCVAYGVLDQGACGSCYAFAAATAYSARLCRFNPGSVGNVVVSPQEMMDCTNGCDGGSPITVFQTLLDHPAVELWCDPYTQRKSTCGGVCATGNSYSAQAGSIKVVGSAGAGGVLQIQLELMRNGPGVVNFECYDDFFSYSSGVYIRSASAKFEGFGPDCLSVCVCVCVRAGACVCEEATRRPPMYAESDAELSAGTVRARANASPSRRRTPQRCGDLQVLLLDDSDSDGPIVRAALGARGTGRAGSGSGAACASAALGLGRSGAPALGTGRRFRVAAGPGLRIKPDTALRQPRPTPPEGGAAAATAKRHCPRLRRSRPDAAAATESLPLDEARPWR